MLIAKGYTILKELSEGRTSVIYSGIRDADQKKVILKTTSTDQPSLRDIALVQHEYQILKDLNLPGISQVVDLTFQQRRPILVLEYISNKSLKEFIDGKPLPLDKFFKIAIELVKIVQTLHAQHIIHKDIKPDNIIINPDDLTIQLVDFGISGQLSLTIQEGLQPHQLEGTLAYMSPEQTGRLNRNVDYRSDFYALGITFYEMLTGVLPFESKDALQLIYCHLANSPPSILSMNPKVPEQLEALVNKLIAKIPEGRYTSAAGIEADLLECAHQWSKKKTISPFPLGSKDIHDHLYISRKLYGREAQIDQLKNIFEQVSQGAKQLVLVSGYSGVGKTSLIREVKSQITQERGYFISGKFEQFQRNVPYSAFIQAFEELINRLLSESQEKIEEIKNTLLAALGGNARAIMNVVPTLELIIGPQPSIPELGPKETQNRFLTVMQNFLEALAIRERPITFFIDDWQWSDSASQGILKYLGESNILKYVLFIVAYRDNEVTADHPFSMLIKSLEKTKGLLNSVHLAPLTEESIGQLLMDSLNTNERVKPLAHLLLTKTHGNPFFINEFLDNLYQKNFLYFNYKKGQWEWDLQGIEKESHTTNVADLLANKLHSLPKETQEILKTAACVGYNFNLQTLAAVGQRSIHQVNQELWAAIQEDLVIPADNTYQLLEVRPEEDEETFILGKEISYHFIHDRIQQTAYSLLSPKKKKEIHLRLGRFLRDNTPGLIVDKHLIDIVNHLNFGEELITDSAERHEMAKLNLEAAQIARKANAYQLAKEYSLQGIHYLSSESWENDYELTFELYYELTQDEYLNGEFQKGEKNFSLLLKKSRKDEYKIRIYLLLSQLYTISARYVEAIQYAINALNLLGHQLPPHPSKFQLLKEIIYVKWLLRGKRTEKILLAPEVQDKKILTILKILNSIIPASIISANPLLLGLISLRIMSFSLRYGNSPYASSGYLGYAMLPNIPFLDSRKKWVDTAYAFGQLAVQLADRYNISSSRAFTYFYYAFMIYHFHNPLKDGLRYFQESYLLSMESGNLVFVGANACQMVTTLLLSGDFLDHALKAAEAGLLAVEKSNDRDELIVLNLLKQFCLNLMNGTESSLWTFKTYGEEKLITYMKKNKILRALFIYYLWKSYYSYLLGDYKNSMQNNKALEELHNKKFVPNSYLWMTYYFIYPLSLIASCEGLPESERRQKLKKAKKFLKTLEQQAEINPDNYLNKYHLVKAEYARVTHQTKASLDDYLQAIKIAKTQGLLPEEAIAHELLGKLYLELGDTGSGYSHLHAASYMFNIWGAKAKKEQLETLYPAIIRRSAENYQATTTMQITRTAVPDMLEEETLDFASVLKVSQAISSEIDLEKLLASLLSILIENSVAQQGSLITKIGENFVIEAESSNGVEKVYLNNQKNIKDSKDLPLTLINYVQRVEKPLILQDAVNSTYAPLDPYLREKKPKSILILPIFYQGQLKNLVYLENNLMTGAFTEKHLSILKFLSSQATISLENARLYHQATHDHLTSLANRNSLEITFPRILESSIQQGQFVGIIFVDLDNFKTINDTMGHAIGDQFLIYVAEKFRTVTRPSDLVTRLGGDEFVIILSGLKNKQQVIDIIERLYKLLSKPVMIEGQLISPSLSIGIALYPSDGKDEDTLMKRADDALYKVKEAGKNNYLFWGDKVVPRNRG